MKFVEASFFDRSFTPSGAYIFDADNPRELLTFEIRQREAVHDGYVVAVTPLPSGARIVAKLHGAGWRRIANSKERRA